jgi:SAM-dependent methyltransferase
LPLLFLWIRASLRKQHNVTVVHRLAEDTDLLAEKVDAVLIANTYHELRNPTAILDHVFRSLAPGGRFVVLDRGPQSTNGQHEEPRAHHHQLPTANVEHELLQSGFEIISRQDDFIEQPKESWWLIVARKP